MVIDNTGPTLEFDKKTGIKELTSSDLTNESYDGQDYTAYWVHGKLYDDTIDYLKSRGYDITQEANTAFAYQDSYWPTAQFSPYVNGEFKTAGKYCKEK